MFPPVINVIAAVNSTVAAVQSHTGIFPLNSRAPAIPHSGKHTV